MILHWNGSKWSPVTSPVLAKGNELNAVYATAADNVWAVGCGAPYGNYPVGNALILHWNGKAWSRQTGVPAIPGCLSSVTASGSSVWAVGQNANYDNAVILHRTGGHWYVVPAPTAQSQTTGDYVVATGANTAWLGGVNAVSPQSASFLLRWNGNEWRPVSFPYDGGNDDVTAMTVFPSGMLLAVGYRYEHGDLNIPYGISMRWNGRTWQTVAVPDPKNRALTAVAFVHGGTAWAVGYVSTNSYLTPRTLIMRWTGKAWVRVSSPNVGGNGTLNAVAATSAGNAWAVGSSTVVAPDAIYSLILHWNGKNWS
jgi:hypothetical protein